MLWTVAILLRAGITSHMARVLALFIHRGVALPLVTVAILTILVARRVDLGKTLSCLAQFVSSCRLRSIFSLSLALVEGSLVLASHVVFLLVAHIFMQLLNGHSLVCHYRLSH